MEECRASRKVPKDTFNFERAIRYITKQGRRLIYTNEVWHPLLILDALTPTDEANLEKLWAETCLVSLFQLAARSRTARTPHMQRAITSATNVSENHNADIDSRMERATQVVITRGTLAVVPGKGDGDLNYGERLSADINSQGCRESGSAKRRAK